MDSPHYFVVAVMGANAGEIENMQICGFAADDASARIATPLLKASVAFAVIVLSACGLTTTSSLACSSRSLCAAF
jgi:hypothetical protein